MLEVSGIPLLKSPWPLPNCRDTNWSKERPTTCQTAMEIMLSSLRGRSELVHLDDMFFVKNRLWSSRPYTSGTETMIKWRQDAQVEKCFFFEETTKHLGRAIRSRRMEIAKATTKVIRELQDPTTQMEERFLLSLCNDFRLFLPSFCEFRPR